MKIQIACILYLLPVLPVSGQQGHYSLGARSGALAGANITLNDGFSFFNNPALLANTSSQLAAGYQNRFGWEGLQAAGVMYAQKLSMLGVGAGFYRFGDALYHEQYAAVAAGYRQGIASVGLKVGWLQYGIQGFGTRHLPYLEIGSWVQIGNQWQLGGLLTNATFTRFHPSGELRVPIHLRLGASFQAAKKLLFFLQIQQALSSATEIIVASEYQLFSKAVLRMGLRPLQRLFSGGIGYSYKGWKWDYALVSHYPQGFDHQLSVTYQWHSGE